ncbi:hypothetical protein J3R83DRAFT_4279 [Lanmaoa asiatica]|nr:hypothetical protein J3R83DRAFT_4279 [Lanmaoa asiatica]
MAENQQLTKFVVWAPDYTDASTLEKRLAVRPSHLETIHRLSKEGTIRKHQVAALTNNRRLMEAHHGITQVLVEAVLTPDSANAAPADRKFFGSCVIIEAESLEAARKVVENDVYYTAGVVSRPLYRSRVWTFLCIHGMAKWDKEKIQILPIMLALPLPHVSA